MGARLYKMFCQCLKIAYFLSRGFLLDFFLNCLYQIPDFQKSSESDFLYWIKKKPNMVSFQDGRKQNSVPLKLDH